MEGCSPQLTRFVGTVKGGGMAARQGPRYGLYDRVLDWFTDHRDQLVKGFLILAVLAMVGGIVLSVIASAS